MSRYYSKHPEYSKITESENEIRNRIIALISKHTREMEGYSYYGSNPGVSEDDYEDIADDIMIEFGLK
jgi:hypothetical protein